MNRWEPKLWSGKHIYPMLLPIRKEVQKVHIHALIMRVCWKQVQQHARLSFIPQFSLFVVPPGNLPNIPNWHQTYRSHCPPRGPLKKVKWTETTAGCTFHTSTNWVGICKSCGKGKNRPAKSREVRPQQCMDHQSMVQEGSKAGRGNVSRWGENYPLLQSTPGQSQYRSGSQEAGKDWWHKNTMARAGLPLRSVLVPRWIAGLGCFLWLSSPD